MGSDCEGDWHFALGWFRRCVRELAKEGVGSIDSGKVGLYRKHKHVVGSVECGRIAYPWEGNISQARELFETSKYKIHKVKSTLPS